MMHLPDMRAPHVQLAACQALSPAALPSTRPGRPLRQQTRQSGTMQGSPSGDCEKLDDEGADGLLNLAGDTQKRGWPGLKQELKCQLKLAPPLSVASLGNCERAR